MAKTKSGKKKVFVRKHERKETTVRAHYRSTPNPSGSKHGHQRIGKKWLFWR